MFNHFITRSLSISVRGQQGWLRHGANDDKPQLERSSPRADQPGFFTLHKSTLLGTGAHARFTTDTLPGPLTLIDYR